MAKPNYSFEKRQKEIAKKKKQEEKLAEKRQRKGTPEGEAAAAGDSVADDTATEPSPEA